MHGTCIKIKKVVVDYLKSGYSSLFARSNKEQSQWKCPKRVGFNGKCFNVFYFLFPFQFSLYSPPISRYICRRNTFLWIFFARLLWQMELQTSYIWQCKWTSLLIFTVSTCSTPFTCREPREINSLIHSLTHSFTHSLSELQLNFHLTIPWRSFDVLGQSQYILSLTDLVMKCVAVLALFERELCYRHFGRMCPFICEIRGPHILESLFRVKTWLYLHISTLNAGRMLFRNLLT